MNCQQRLLDTQPSDTSAEKKTSKDASHHCFTFIVLTLCIFFFFLHKAPVQFLEGRQVTKASITCRVFITSCPGKMKNDTLQMAFWSLSIIHLTLQRLWQRWLYFIATSEITDLPTYFNQFAVEREWNEPGSHWIWWSGVLESHCPCWPPVDKLFASRSWF